MEIEAVEKIEDMEIQVEDVEKIEEMKEAADMQVGEGRERETKLVEDINEINDVKKDVGMEREVDSDDFLLLRKSHSQAGSAIQYTYCQVKDLF